MAQCARHPPLWMFLSDCGHAIAIGPTLRTSFGFGRRISPAIVCLNLPFFGIEGKNYIMVWRIKFSLYWILRLTQLSVKRWRILLFLPRRYPAPAPAGLASRTTSKAQFRIHLPDNSKEIPLPWLLNRRRISIVPWKIALFNSRPPSPLSSRV